MLEIYRLLSLYRSDFDLTTTCRLTRVAKSGWKVSASRGNLLSLASIRFSHATLYSRQLPYYKTGLFHLES